MINREKFEERCEALIAKYNVRVDWDANPITGFVWDGELDLDASALLTSADASEVRKYIKNRDKILARKAAQAKPETAQETAPATLTLEEQMAAIKTREAERSKVWAENRRRMERGTSVFLAEPSVEEVRKQYPEAAAELDARRAKAEAEAKAERAARIANLDPWNL